MENKIDRRDWNANEDGTYTSEKKENKKYGQRK